MSKAKARKPFYSLAEACERWSFSEEDIAAFVLEDEITLSVAVGGRRFDTVEMFEDDRGQWHTIPTGTRWVVGTVDLAPTTAWAVLRQGALGVGRFYAADKEILDVPDRNDEPDEMMVERQSLVVRRAELERFEEVQGVGPTADAIAAAPSQESAGRTRGAPPRYDWEGCWCEIAATIYDPGVPATQAEWLEQLRDWFAAKLGPDKVPSDSSIKQRLSQIWPRVKPDVSRPSAQTQVAGGRTTSTGEKGRRIGR